jgi:pimeloyl-ACP methyl ester carboxylesterase
MAAELNENYRRVRVPQGSVCYREFGTGAPVVFVHGLMVNGALWRKVAPRLAKHYRCIVPDWPLGSHNVTLNSDADHPLRKAMIGSTSAARRAGR